VVEHGVVDPGHRYTGDLARAGILVNEPVRRGRAVGTDVVLRLAENLPVDLFGMGADALEPTPVTPTGHLATYDSLPQARVHEELARRRVYVHTSRWTSLGLSLLEAMHLGMPVVALATTEAHRAVLPGTGVLTVDVDAMIGATQRLLEDPDAAAEHGRRGREVVLTRYGLGRFLDDWDGLLERYAG
jgi:glycosyltransferase involved in cell wall biosynthesis